MSTGSFVICAYNAERFLARTLNSCINQTIAPEKIIIADDGSTDGTRSIIMGFNARFPDLIVPVLCNVNQGRSITIDQALDQVRSRYCLLIDADDIAVPERVQRQIWFMEANPEVQLSSSFVRYIDENDRAIASGKIDILTPDQYSRYMSNNEVIGLFCPAVILRTSLIQKRDLRFRQQFWPCDDLDLWNRIAESGHLIQAQPEFLTHYRLHSRSAVTSSFKKTRLRYEYMRTCMSRRRSGQGEPTWHDFMTEWNARPILTKMNTWRKTEAKARYRNAGFLLAQRKYPKAALNLSIAMLAQPRYALPRLLQQMKR